MASLVQIDAYDPVAAAALTLYACSHDDPAVCHANGGTYWPAIAKLPTLRYDLFDGAFGDAITAPSSSLTLQVEPWPNFGRYSFPDARIRLWTGDPADPANVWTLRFDGRVSAQPQIENGAAQLDFAADDRWLDKSLLTTYAGTTGAEGPLAMKGQAKPLALGAPRFVPGKLIDSVNSVFQISSYGPLQSIDTALEKLARFGAPIADYATYAALVAATIPAGQWATATAVGMARFGAPPAGQISFLVNGENAGPNGWARKPGQLIRRLALLSGGAGKIDDASLDALDVARPYNVSVYLDDQTTAREMIQKIAASVNAVAGVSWTGQLFVAPVGIGAPTVTLSADGTTLPPVASVQQIDIASPWQKLALGAERAWRVHAMGDIAFTAPLLPLGIYSATTIYREGNIVDLADGSSFLYVNTTPASGHTPPAGTQPPTAPASDAYWYQQKPPTSLTAIGFTGDSDAQRNSRIAVSGGQITGIGTGNGSNVDNGYITVSVGNIQGIGAGNGTAVGNSLISIGANGALAGAGGGQVTVAGIGYAGALSALDATAYAQLGAAYSGVLAALDDEILTAQEKSTSLVPLAGQLEQQYQGLLIRATALGVSTTALTADRTAWLGMLSGISPGWSDITQDSSLAAPNLITVPFPSGGAGGWTPDAVTTAAAGIYTTVTDTSNTRLGQLPTVKSVSLAGVAKTYTVGVYVRKDAIGRATRFSTLSVTFNGGTQKGLSIRFDTSTGEFSGAGSFDACGGVDVGEAWYFWCTGTTNTTTNQIIFSVIPANGASLTWVSNIATTGSTDFREPVLVEGDFSKLGRIALRGALADYVAELENVRKLVSAEDAKNALWSGVASRPANLSALVGAEGINNALVSIAANGALSGAGGGQVTLTGVGFTGDTDAQRNSRITVDGTGALTGIGTGVNSIVQNTKISVSVGLISGIGTGNNTAVGNSLLSIGANGALAGGGGGQVTIGGLGFTGDTDAQRNSRITVASGVLTGIGTPSVTVDNGYISISAGTLLGIGSGAGTAVANSLVSIGSNGTLSGGGGGQVTIAGLGYTGALNATKNTPTYSSAAPSSPTDGDIWGDTSVSPTAFKMRVGGAWQIAANYATNTNQLTDGANLGLTAIWSSVSSRPANLSALSGSEGINNASVSLSAGGALAGAGGGQILYDSLADGSIYVRVKATDVTGGNIKLGIAGSGAKLGDARNLPAVQAANLRYKFTGAVTYSSAAGTPATATISVAAGSALLGSTSVNYSAMSVGVSGTGGTTITYWLYVDDASYSGGAKTLVATTTATDIYSSDARVYIGSVDVTFPTTGTGGGGGGGGGGYCVAAASFMPCGRNASDLAAGDALTILDYATLDSLAVGEVTGMELVEAECVEIITESGIALVASTSTPITLRDGSIASIRDAVGHDLPVIDAGDFRWEPAVEVRSCGTRLVARIHADGATYAAGAQPGRFILTHNPAKP